MHLNLTICYQYFLVGSCILVTVQCQSVGSNCVNSDGTKGECKAMSDCPTGIKMLRSMGQHSLHRCSFQAFDEIVCCPNEIVSNISSSIFTGLGLVLERKLSSRKSIIACEGFMNNSLARVGPLIINGLNTQDGEFPHMAALGYVDEEGTSWDCGGTLIASRYILTAGHCIIRSNGIKPSKVRLGTIDLTDETAPNKQDFDVENIIVHPEFRRLKRINDIAIIKLNSTVKFTEYIQPACLWTDKEIPKNFTITGWGDINSRERSPNWKTLQKANTYRSDFEECKDVFMKRIERNITENHICALDPNPINRTDACLGDSGGPLQVQNPRDSNLFSLVGIISFGLGCAEVYPSVYTKVSSYLDFIENNVWPN